MNFADVFFPMPLLAIGGLLIFFAGFFTGYGTGREIGWRRGARISWTKYLKGER